MFNYFTPPIEFDSETVPCHIGVVASGSKDAKNLLGAAGAALSLPAHYGKNWDAFWDCIRDFADDMPHRIVLVHNELPALQPEEQRLYLTLLRDATLYWNNYPEEHLLEVWFPMRDRDAIRVLTGNLPPPTDID